MRETSIAVSYTRDPFTFYLAAALIYLGLTTAITAPIHALERRTSYGMKTLSAP